MTVKLSEENAKTIIRDYDGYFDHLVDMAELTRIRLAPGRNLSDSSYETPVKTYVATYTRTPPSGMSLQRPESDLPTGPSRILISISIAPKDLNSLTSIHDTIQKHTSIPLIPLLKRDDNVIIPGLCYALYAPPKGFPLSWLYSDTGDTSTSQSSPSHSSELESSHLISTPNLPSETRLKLRLKIELKLGTLFKELHDEVQNDYFGLPWVGAGREKLSEGWEECYSWQEGFTRLVEELIAEAERLLAERKVTEKESEKFAEEEEEEEEEIPAKTIHRLLSRSIGFFLFDDVEVPSLIFHPFGDWASRIFVSTTPSSSSPSTSSATNVQERERERGRGEEEVKRSIGEVDDAEITAIIGWEHLLWGDPLMDGVFYSPPSSPPNISDKNIWPSKAFLEGYQTNPIVLPRHRTKRLWYDLFAELSGLIGILSGRPSKSIAGEGKGKIDGWEGGRDAWGGKGGDGAVRILKEIREIVKKLEDAPCY